VTSSARRFISISACAGGNPIYLENRFVNLIWGMESYHRSKGTKRVADVKLQEKIDRILAHVPKKDVKWLARQLNHGAEPSLETRIFETLISLPLNLDQDRCRAFAKSCGDRRNEISHYGGQRQNGIYNDFIMDLAKKSDALEYLHHALLLHEMQIEDKIVYNYIFNNYKSYHIK
jgi:epoxyqueuosine reductase QueG